MISEASESFTAFGPVTTDESDPGYVGAARLTNNTAELNAILEALVYVYTFPATTFHFHVDSTYVLRLVQGKFAPKENYVLSSLVVRWWERVQSKHSVSIS